MKRRTARQRKKRASKKLIKPCDVRYWCAEGAMPFEPRGPYRPWINSGVSGSRGDKPNLIGLCIDV